LEPLFEISVVPSPKLVASVKATSTDVEEKGGTEEPVKVQFATLRLEPRLVPVGSTMLVVVKPAPASWGSLGETKPSVVAKPLKLEVDTWSMESAPEGPWFVTW